MGEAKQRRATGEPGPKRPGRQGKQALIWGGALVAVLALGGLAVPGDTRQRASHCIARCT